MTRFADEATLAYIAELEGKLADTRRLALEEAAKVCDTLTFGTEISEWRRMTKQEVSSRACVQCATAIRALAARPGRKGE